MDAAAATLRGIAEVYRAGASKSREWTYNNDAQIQACVYDAMADEAEHQANILEGY